jgi:hypothetical protein
MKSKRRHDLPTTRDRLRIAWVRTEKERSSRASSQARQREENWNWRSPCHVRFLPCSVAWCCYSTIVWMAHIMYYVHALPMGYLSLFEAVGRGLPSEYCACQWWPQSSTSTSVIAAQFRTGNSMPQTSRLGEILIPRVRNLEPSWQTCRRIIFSYEY